MTRRPRGIFISYRREDAAGEAGRLADHLARRFGRRAVFFDVEQIVPGDDWRQRLDSALEACDTVLVVVGRNWLEAPNAPHRRRRIDDPGDVVAGEIAEGLRRGLRVIQAYVQATSPVKPDVLPSHIAALAMRQAYFLRHESFANDVRRLGDHIVASRRVRRTLGRDWPSSDLTAWVRPSPWSTFKKGEAPFSTEAVATVLAMELLLRRSGVEAALSAGYVDARARSFEGATLQHGELALSTCIYVASLIGVPLARQWPRSVAPRRRPQRGNWEQFEFDSYSGRWCRGDFFKVDGLADAVRQLAAGRPIVCLCWFDYRESDGDWPIDDAGVLRRAPAIKHRNARAPILIAGYDSTRRRFRCMFATGSADAASPWTFEVPVEVARAAFEVQLMWAVEVPEAYIDRLRPRKRRDRHV